MIGDRTCLVVDVRGCLMVDDADSLMVDAADCLMPAGVGGPGAASVGGSEAAGAGYCSGGEGKGPVLFVQLSAKHEAKGMDEEIRLLKSMCSRGFVFVAVVLDDWTGALMPWEDEAVTRKRMKRKGDNSNEVKRENVLGDRGNRGGAEVERGACGDGELKRGVCGYGEPKRDVCGDADLKRDACGDGDLKRDACGDGELKRGACGEAEETLAYIEDVLLPWIKRAYGDMPCVLAGYSLGGLFALWAAYRTESFDGICAVSPSLWVRGWDAYAEGRVACADAVYLSLGDKEERARNVRMAAVGDCVRRQASRLTRQFTEGKTVFEWNRGGHFDDEPGRMARGLAWTAERV